MSPPWQPYHDDDLPGPDGAVGLALDNLPLTNVVVTLTHYRIDNEHSNSFQEWKRMGSPNTPTHGQYAQLLKAGQLAELEAPETVGMEIGRTIFHLKLPRQAVSLLVLTWN